MAIWLSITAFLLVGGAIILFGYRRYVLAGQTYENLSETSAAVSLRHPENPDFFSVKKIALAIAAKLPASPAHASALQLKMMSAGYRSENAAAMHYGFKLLSMALVTALMLFIEARSEASGLLRIMGILVGVMSGFRIPDYIVAKRIKDRQTRLRKALPDALDLMVVCAEAGLTIDRAFRNVTHHMASTHRELSEEFNLVSAEISAGLRRKEALENLVIRTQEPELRKFVAVVAQADRFGTSMGEALRTHADHLRVCRRQLAEEKASKVSVKMIFPIFFFIMPCMLLVTVGPAVLIIMKELVPALTGAN